ncbi:MAG: molybdopterin oxidoreductase [Oscillospiraceae bacterium]|nr:molybdopterin oxidoreductase [Oscillospiraceae bacterium]
MSHRDYLWCALHLALDGEEELERLCPSCRMEAEESRCPVCGAAVSDCGENRGFDMERFLEMGGERA